MKKKVYRTINIFLLIFTYVAVFLLGYTNDGYIQKRLEVNTPRDAIIRLINGNDLFLIARTNRANISKKRIIETSSSSDKPYAVIVTCPDSRLSAEHIFQEGIGDLFVIRSAGTIITDIDLESIEYAVLNLGAKAIVVLGHTDCAAVSSTLYPHKEDSADSHITNHITPAIIYATSEEEAIFLNTRNSFYQILENQKFIELINSKELIVSFAIYDMTTGKVDFMM